MGPHNRREFLQSSAAAAAALTLGPLTHESRAETIAPNTSGVSGPGAREIEEKLLRARPVPLTDVRVTGGPAKLAQEADAKYLLSLDPDRMMAFYRVRAGLPQKAEPYGGWDGGGRNLTGHIAGHHLSAVSLMYAATGDDRFKQRAQYIVRELKEVQDKNGDGYLSALEHGRESFAQVSKGEIRPGAFDLNGLWSPWYTLHKTYAGLRDAYRYTGDKTALDVETKFAAWAEGVLAPLSDAQVQKMLLTEHGGMNEVLADLYVDTGDKRWLDLSYRFEHRAFTDALKRGQDNLAGKHVNCQIPKVIGSAARYGYTGDTGDILAASTFFDRAVEHHTYATGGQGSAEYFGPADVLGSRVDGRTCESCNCYNMLKLSRRLFSFRPDAFYADFQERVLFNHVLASMDPANARMSYMVPVGRGVQQEYQNMQQSFTCCVGTGMENHALHGYGVYYESDDTLWVSLFMPSTAKFKLAGAQITQETTFPDGDSAALKLTLPKAAKFTLAVRRPTWAGDGFVVKVNGTPVEVPPLASLRPGAAGGRLMGNEDSLPQPSSFVEISRTWNNGDTVELTLPKTVRLEATPDDKRIAADHVGTASARGRPGSAPRIARRGRARPTGAAPRRGRASGLRVGSSRRATRRFPDQAGRPPDHAAGAVGRRFAHAVLPDARAHVQRLFRRRHAGRVRRTRRGAVGRARTRSPDGSRDGRVRSSRRSANRAELRLQERPRRSPSGAHEWPSVACRHGMVLVRPRGESSVPDGDRRHVLQRDRSPARARQLRDRRRWSVGGQVRTQPHGDRILRRAL